MMTIIRRIVNFTYDKFYYVSYFHIIFIFIIFIKLQFSNYNDQIINFGEGYVEYPDMLKFFWTAIIEFALFCHPAYLLLLCLIIKKNEPIRICGIYY